MGLEDLYRLKSQVIEARSLHEKLQVLDKHPHVISFFSSPSYLKSFLAGLSPECEYVCKSVVAIGQGERVFSFDEKMSEGAAKLRQLLSDLLAIESFHKDLGGIIGYQLQMLALLSPKKTQSYAQFYPPETIDIRKDTPWVKEAIYQGIKHLPEIGEIYPLGGAGDRLRLTETETGKLLPASRLKFIGRTLLEGLIRDLEAREHLYEKLFGEKIVTPIAMMTSHEKDNHEHVLAICEENNWFNRPKESFTLFCQPSVPLITKEGNWCLNGPLTLLLKPGGHGVIWKLALQQRIFDWFYKKGRTKALIRQINNPIASIDYGILAFMGYGHTQKKAFGFASCPRKVLTKEGVNVLIKKEKKACVSNIEYCDFTKYGIEDAPCKEERVHSQFPSNTNILFANLREIESLAQKHPYPGLLLNFKKHAHFDPKKGDIISPTARVESTMQNIADYLEVDVSDTLSTYITFNHRHKTISAVKNNSEKEGLETPERCFRDFVKNAHDLLTNFCGYSLPSLTEAFPFLFTYHPSLGPLYSIIGQKLRGGRLETGSELSLELSDVWLENLHLKGSLLISSVSEIGAGRCIFKNVRVENQGINLNADQNVFWKSELDRKESLSIILNQNSELIADNIAFKGNQTIEVPANRRFVAKESAGQLQWEDLPSSSKPLWSYASTPQRDIILHL